MEKLCRKCNRVQPIGDFHKNRKLRDGVQSYCKECMKRSTRDHQKTEKGRAILKRAAQKQIDSGYNRFGKGAIAILSAGARRRGIVFDLTADSLATWWHATPDVCHYCGLSINEYFSVRNAVLAYDGHNNEITKYRRFFRTRVQRAIRWMTIDRADNSRGYLISNIVKSCWICNSLKGDFFSAEMMGEICPKLLTDLKAAITASQPESNAA